MILVHGQDFTEGSNQYDSLRLWSICSSCRGWPGVYQTLRISVKKWWVVIVFKCILQFGLIGYGPWWWAYWSLRPFTDILSIFNLAVIKCLTIHYSKSCFLFFPMWWMKHHVQVNTMDPRVAHEPIFPSSLATFPMGSLWIGEFTFPRPIRLLPTLGHWLWAANPLVLWMASLLDSSAQLER